MNFRSWKITVWAALLSGASFLSALGADTTGPTSTVPSLSATLTNLNSAMPQKTGMRALEEELSKSLQPFSPRGLDSLLTPRYIPPPISVPTRRSPSDSEKRGTWPLGSADDSSGPHSDPFKSIEGSPRKDSLEDIYNRLSRKESESRSASARARKSTDSGPNSLDEFNDRDLSIPSALRETARSLRDKLLGTDSIFSRPTTSRGLPDMFARQRNSPSPQQIQAHQEYLQRFRQTLDIPEPWATPQNSLQPTLGSTMGWNASPAKPVYTQPNLLTPSSPSGNFFASTPAQADSVLHPTVLPDMNQRVLNQWNPLYTPPKVESPPPLPFSPPMMEVPRRRFF